jgi:hypothetical protein
VVAEYADKGDLQTFYQKKHIIVFEEVFDFALQLAHGTISFRQNCK